MRDTTVYLCDGLFYDSGGADGEYTDGEDITMTFISLLEAGRLKITFREFDVEEETDCGFDYLEAFEGTDVNGTLIGRWCGTELPSTIVIEDVEAAVTFRFHSNDAVARPGWKAEITCDTSVGAPEWQYGSFAIYPNPTSGQVHVNFKRKADRLQLLDLTGQSLYSVDAPSENIVIDTRGLSPGLYLIVASSGKQVTSRKLLVE
jgi:hypothetical protein